MIEEKTAQLQILEKLGKKYQNYESGGLFLIFFFLKKKINNTCFQEKLSRKYYFTNPVILLPSSLFTEIEVLFSHHTTLKRIIFKLFTIYQRSSLFMQHLYKHGLKIHSASHYMLSQRLQ